MLALIAFDGGDVAALDFGAPLERELTPEELVREVLADYAARKGELLDIGPGPASEILTRILETSDGTPAAVLMPIRALGFLGQPPSYEAVAPYINHADRAVRLATIRSLGQLTKFDAIPLIEPYLGSSDREERREAIIGLGKFAKPEEIPKIDRAVAGDPELERRAREATERINASVKDLPKMHFDDLVDAVIDTPEFEDLTAIIFVTKFRLLEIVADRTRAPEAREHAVRVLALARIRRAGMPLRDIVADTGNPIGLRLRAIHGLGLIRTRSAVPQLIELLDGPERGMRELCILSLGRIGDTRALKPLLERWDVAGGTLRGQLRLALFRLRSSPGFQAVLDPLKVYQPRAISEVYFISDALSLSRGYDPAVIQSFLNSTVAEERRDALLLLATFGTDADSGALETYSENDTDPLNREIAHLGVERLKDIPLWDRP